MALLSAVLDEANIDVDTYIFNNDKIPQKGKSLSKKKDEKGRI